MATLRAPTAAATGSRIPVPTGAQWVTFIYKFTPSVTYRQVDINPLWSASRYVGQSVQTSAVR